MITFRVPHGGHVYHQCRYFDGKFFKKQKYLKAFCSHLQQEITDCEGCRICPKCASNTYRDSRIVEHVREGEMWLTTRICPICSLETIGKAELVKKEVGVQGADHMAPPCAVKLCRGRAWERFTHVGEARHHICSKHRDMVQVWRRKGMEKERFPLVEIGGELHENPKYRKAQR